MQIVRQAAFTTKPWKNGGGITHEALRVPAGGDPFSWRVSVARIERSGAFSDFTPYNRIMVLLKGNGAVLKFANGALHPLRNVGDVAEFDGALATWCELENGPCVDLNLMVAKSLPGVEVCVRRLHDSLELHAAPGRSTLIFPIDAPVVLEAEGEDSMTLEPWDLAVTSYSVGTVGRIASTRVSAAAWVFLATVPDA